MSWFSALFLVFDILKCLKICQSDGQENGVNIFNLYSLITMEIDCIVMLVSHFLIPVL